MPVESERKRQRRMVLLVFGIVGIMFVSGVAAIVATEGWEPNAPSPGEEGKGREGVTTTVAKVKAGRAEGRHCVLVGKNSEEPTLVDGVWFCRNCFPPNVDSAVYDWGQRADSQMFQHRSYDKGALSWWKDDESFGFVQDYTVNLNDLPMRAVGSFDNECEVTSITVGLRGFKAAGGRLWDKEPTTAEEWTAWVEQAKIEQRDREREVAGGSRQPGLADWQDWRDSSDG